MRPVRMPSVRFPRGTLGEPAVPRRRVMPSGMRRHTVDGVLYVSYEDVIDWLLDEVPAERRGDFDRVVFGL